MGFTSQVESHPADRGCFSRESALVFFSKAEDAGVWRGSRRAQVPSEAMTRDPVSLAWSEYETPGARRKNRAQAGQGDV